MPEDTQIHCRRYPPQSLMFVDYSVDNEGVTQLRSVYAVVNNDFWCGEGKK